ncbi:MAG TPA: hypothetical protein VKD89_09640, partial [Candidatus Udaeobacter sp.]|nr:hypothetical protein [Candidatus Udaeobacter sp.]
EAVGKWRTQHLLDSEAFSNTDNRHQHAAETNHKKLEECFQHGRALSWPNDNASNAFGWWFDDVVGNV